ncbi:hypothetical protein [Stakelama tenebrarum]|uniref:Uncharacterized protein n=1 Tax=Stakelama tenebrarum TaxID=2711215 RepID=A0A6G6Y2F8_9SPHN|nr:hypothetical protein [Sphingosinithalassobacter tenebrarum]QIG78793.1 hypothetical protein G5C33_02635 [Sphingosinithalassobacter tenebrarum]
MLKLRLILVLIALVALAFPSNSMLPGRGRVAPDLLARWAAANAVRLPLDGSFAAENGARVTPIESGTGIAIAPADGNGPVLRRYLVPAARVASGLDRALRDAIFPGGTARVPAPPQGRPATLGEADAEGIYLVLTSVPASASCRHPDRRCEAVHDIAIVVKLRGVPLIGPNAHALAVPLGPLVDPLAFATTQVAPEPLCGFDPAAARVPHHIAGGCTAMVLTAFASARGFALDGHQRRIVPLSPAALDAYLRESVRQGLTRGGTLRGGWIAGVESA